MADGIKRAPTLVFEGGQLGILAEGFGDKNGSGRLVIKESDLEFDQDGYCTLPLPRSELIAIRDHINKSLRDEVVG